MKEGSKIYFTIMYIVNLILGIIFTITLVGAIFGIPMIIGANKFKNAQNASNQELKEMRTSLFAWGIFFGIIWIGTILVGVLIIVMAILVNNYIEKLSQEDEANDKTIVDNFKETFGIKNGVEKTKEKLEKLKKMLDEGTINEEEYEEMRKKVLDV